jgi:hypothetical protein
MAVSVASDMSGSLGFEWILAGTRRGRKEVTKQKEKPKEGF